MLFFGLLCWAITLISHVATVTCLYPPGQDKESTLDNSASDCGWVRNLTMSVTILHLRHIVLIRLTSRALPFPRFSVVPGTQQSVFLHFTCAWDRIDEQAYYATYHALQMALVHNLRTRGDLTLDADGIQRQVGSLKMSTSTFHTGKY